MKKHIGLILSGAVLAGSFALVGAAQATHSWGGYHWARQSSPFTLSLSSNLTAGWAPYLDTTSADWTASSVLDTRVVTGLKNPKTCRPTAGIVEVCNAKYGANGWLGLAQVWVTGDKHITQGTVKLNDTYMTQPRYNTPSEKNHVMCQEAGHTLGLGHQDESGAVLGTCMDYSMSDTSQSPNAHDYQELEAIYAHLDGTTTVGAATAAAAGQDDLNDQRNWGRRVFRSQGGYLEIYERQFTNGSKLITTVTLAH